MLKRGVFLVGTIITFASLYFLSQATGILIALVMVAIVLFIIA